MRELTLVLWEEDAWRARSGACRDTPRQADLRKIKGHSCCELQPVGRRIARFLRSLLCEESSKIAGVKLYEAAGRCCGGTAEAHPPRRPRAILEDTSAVNSRRFCGP